MMKAITTLLLVFTISSCASVPALSKQTQRPTPAPDWFAAHAQATNPDPFNVRRTQAQVTPTPTPAPTATPAPMPAPVVVNMPAPVEPAAPRPTSLLEWIHAALAALGLGIGGKLAWRLPSMPGAAKLDHSRIADVVAAVLNPKDATSILKDPELKASVDVALLKAIQSGIPGQALQTGLSFIPAAGPIAATLEPMVRKIVIEVLEKKVGSTPIDPAAVHAETDQRLAGIEGILKLLAGKFIDKPAAT